MSAAQPVLRKAQSVLHRPFSRTYADQNGGQHLEAYCAAFVRWCFRATGKPLPVVASPEFYQHLGIAWHGEENTADGLSGRAVGAVVPKGTMAGDILLFRNTYGNWQYGTITHVGIASETNGMMYDAGSGSIVHHRSIEGTFPRKLVEVRRPIILGGHPGANETGASGLPKRMEENATRIHHTGRQVSAKYKGKPMRDLNVLLYHDGRGHVEGHDLHAGLISLIIHDASGKVYKMHRHHNKNFMTEGIEKMWLSVRNGLLEVSYTDPRSTISHDAKSGKTDRAFHPLKPTSVELTILH